MMRMIRNVLVALIVAAASVNFILLFPSRTAVLTGISSVLSGWASPAPMIPADFDWRGYLLLNADVREAGARSPEAAWSHYQAKGRHRTLPGASSSSSSSLGSSSSSPSQLQLQMQLQRAPPILLRYSACGGLFNQMYAHVAALVLADVLGAEVVMPPALYRNSFASRYSAFSNETDLKWEFAPASTLLDIDSVRSSWRASGGKALHEYPLDGALPDCSKPEVAYLPDLPKGIAKEQVIQLEGLHLASLTLDDLWDTAANAVMKKRDGLAASGKFPPDATIVLDLSNPFFSLITVSCIDHASRVARALVFNQTIQDLANLIVSKIAALREHATGTADAEGDTGGAREGSKGKDTGERLSPLVAAFNGIHFRMERDAADWARIYGGTEAYLKLYVEAAKGAGLGGGPGSLDLYVASGLLSYANETELAWLHEALGPLGGRLLFKEAILSQQELAVLNTEQMALLDFLVLAQCQTFVGLGTSTFSVYLREYRRLKGVTSRNAFVRSKDVGTDVLFQRCSHLVPY